MRTERPANKKLDTMWIKKHLVRNSEGLVIGFKGQGIFFFFFLNTECNYLLFWPGGIASPNFWVQFRFWTKQNSFKGFGHQNENNCYRRHWEVQLPFPLQLMMRSTYSTDNWRGSLAPDHFYTVLCGSWHRSAETLTRREVKFLFKVQKVSLAV